MLKLILLGRPITKKNNSRIVRHFERPRLIPSQQYVNYEVDCLRQITGKYQQKLSGRYNMRVHYYMPTKHKVDLVNLLEATCDILVKGNVIADDNSTIIAGHDGSRVYYDKDNPRVEITIEEIL